MEVYNKLKRLLTYFNRTRHYELNKQDYEDVIQNTVLYLLKNNKLEAPNDHLVTTLKTQVGILHKNKIPNGKMRELTSYNTGVVSTVEDDIYEIEMVKIINKLGSISKRDRSIILDCIMSGDSKISIAEKYNVTKQTLNDLIKRHKDLLKETLT